MDNSHLIKMGQSHINHWVKELEWIAEGRRHFDTEADRAKAIEEYDTWIRDWSLVLTRLGAK